VTAPTPAAAAPRREDLSQQFIDIVARVSGSVVSIDAIKVEAGYRHPFSDPFLPWSEGDPILPERRIPSVGSGWIVDPKGHILTNHHVIKGLQEVRVTLADNRVAPAQWVGSDSASDLAVLKIDLKELPALPWGSSQDLRPGEFVLAFGSPFRMRGSVSHGIVSAKGRQNLGIADFENFIQTDAAINPGNSGGPLCNLKGEVVGVNTALLSKSGGSQGIGLAIPSEVARSVFEEIVKKGRVDRAWLGLWVEPVTADLARDLRLPAARGVMVQGGYRSGPAVRAGLEAGDVVLEMDGQAVQDVRHFRTLLAALPVDRRIEILAWRRGRMLKLKVTTELRAVDRLGRPARGL
jgi:S1-C subfamily serine protease